MYILVNATFFFFFGSCVILPVCNLTANNFFAKNSLRAANLRKFFCKVIAAFSCRNMSNFFSAAFLRAIHCTLIVISRMRI